MVFPEDFDYERRQAREHRKEFIELSEDIEREEGDISTADTVNGRERLPGILGDEDEDIEETLGEQGMHIMDEDEFEMLEDPYDSDGYLDDDEDDEDDDPL